MNQPTEQPKTHRDVDPEKSPPNAANTGLWHILFNGTVLAVMGLIVVGIAAWIIFN